MKYFITGATGFIGSAIIRMLRENGHTVHALVRDPEKAEFLKSKGVDIFKGDITDKETMRAGMTGADGVYHIAGWYKVGTRDKYNGKIINIDGSRNVFELMKELKIPKGVYTSTLAVNSHTHGVPVNETYHYTGKHLSVYDKSKWLTHKLANEYIAGGLPLVIVQPGLVYGPGDTSSVRENLLELFKGRMPAVPSQFLGCWAHIDDIAIGHLLAMEKGKAGETYIIGGEPVKFADVFKMAAEISGKRPPMILPYQAFKVLSILTKPFDAILPPTYTSEGLRVVAGTTYWGDDGKARRELGYNPRPFKEGWTETVRHEMALLGMN